MPRVTGEMRPTGTSATYAVVSDDYKRGGWRPVATLADRDAITQDRRSADMQVYVRDEWTTYRVVGDPVDNVWAVVNNEINILAFGVLNVIPVDPLDRVDQGAAINDALTFCANNGFTLRFATGEYYTTIPIQVPSNSDIIADNNAWIVNYNPHANDFEVFSYAIIRNRNPNSDSNVLTNIGPAPRSSVTKLTENIRIRGLKLKVIEPYGANATEMAANTTHARGMVLVGCWNVVLEDIWVLRTYTNWAFTFYCKNISADGLKVLNNQLVFEDGIHLLGGQNNLYTNFDIQSGDDSLATGWGSSDVFLRDVLFLNGVVRSERGHAIRVISPNPAVACTQFVEKIKFANITGFAGSQRNAGIFLQEEESPFAGIIRKVDIDNVEIECSAGGAIDIQAIFIGTPGVVAIMDHSMVASRAFTFSTTGFLPTGLLTNTTYYVLASGLGTNSFQFSLTDGGAAINVSDSGSGSHKVNLQHDNVNPYGLWMLGSADVKVNKLRITGTKSEAVLLDTCQGPVTLTGCNFVTPTTSGIATCRVNSCGTHPVKFNDCTVENNNDIAIETVHSSMVLVNNRIIMGRFPVALTVASPGVVTLEDHGLLADQPFTFSTEDKLPTNAKYGTLFYVSATNLAANTFEYSVTIGGPSINTFGVVAGQTYINLKSSSLKAVTCQLGSSADRSIHIAGNIITGTELIVFEKTGVGLLDEFLMVNNEVPDGSTITDSESLRRMVWGNVGLDVEPNFLSTDIEVNRIIARSLDLTDVTPVMTVTDSTVFGPGFKINVYGTNSGALFRLQEALKTRYFFGSGINRGLTMGDFAEGAPLAVTIDVPSSTFTLVNHGFTLNQRVVFATTGTLPSNVIAGTTYYVMSTIGTLDTFQISTTSSGALLVLTGSSVDPHTVSAPPPSACILRAAPASGTNVAGSSLQLESGYGTGNASGNRRIIMSLPQVGASGSTPQTLRTNFIFEPEGHVWWVGLTSHPTLNLQDGNIWFRSDLFRWFKRSRGQSVPLNSPTMLAPAPSGTVNVLAADELLVLSNPTAIVVNLLPGYTGQQLEFKNIGAGTATLTPNGSEMIFTTAEVATLAMVTGDYVRLYFDGTIWLKL